MSTLSHTIAATAGLAIGSVVTFFIVRDKYRKIANDEIATMREYYLKREKSLEKSQDDSKKKTPDSEVIESPEASEAHKKLKKVPKPEFVDYAAPYRLNSDEKKGVVTPTNAPKKDDIYTITEKDFNESDYEIQTLTFYADHVLADDDYNVVEDVVGNIGRDALKGFKEDKNGNIADVIYVRNERLKIDFEIIYDERSYARLAPSWRRIDSEEEDEE